MKVLFISLIMAASLTANAAVNSIDQARLVKANVLSQLAGLAGVNGVGIGACDIRTQAVLSQVDSPKVEYCVVINVMDGPTLKGIQDAFPEGTRVNGILVKAKLVGDIHEDPRMSGGT